MPPSTPPMLALVIPCYNESEVLTHTMARVKTLLDEYAAEGRIHPDSKVWYVDDGSSDDTWSIIEQRCAQDPSCRGIKLANNVGHQNALLAGLLELPDDVDCAVSLDADLQDDVTVIKEMLEVHAAGFDQVFGVRSDRGSDKAFKRITASWFYSLMGLLGVRLVPQHADFRLSGRKVLDALRCYGERNIFLRGIFPNMGFKQSIVRYSRQKRLYGTTKYPFGKMLALAWQGITSFSTAPLRFAGFLSLGTFFLAVIETFRALITWMSGETVPGWSSLIITILYLGAIQLFSLAVIGEYLGKIYMEVKKRPRYIVDRKTPD